jgi:hypothetical protein
MVHPISICLGRDETPNGTKSKYNKVQSAGYKDLNTIFVLSWLREKRREKRCWL